VQVIPHVTERDQGADPGHGGADEDGRSPDVVITEVGGTVGDIESCRSWRRSGRSATTSAGTTASTARVARAVPRAQRRAEDQADPALGRPLRNIGIQPDALVCRSDREIPEKLKLKLSLYCDVDREAVVSAADAPSIYDIPKVLHREGLDAYVVRRLGLSFRDVDWSRWDDLLERVHHPKQTVTVAIVGKYVDLPDAYLSVSEAVRAAGFAHHARVEIRWVPSDDCVSPTGAAAALSGCGRCGDPRWIRGAGDRGEDRRRSGTPGNAASRRWACVWDCSA
jgi:CTP synthase